LRPAGGFYAQVWHVPHLFQKFSAEGRIARSEEVELVIDQEQKVKSKEQKCRAKFKKNEVFNFNF